MPTTAVRVTYRYNQPGDDVMVETEMPTKKRSKMWHLAFQTLIENRLRHHDHKGFRVSHQPHGGGDGAKCGAKLADTRHVI